MVVLTYSVLIYQIYRDLIIHNVDTNKDTIQAEKTTSLKLVALYAVLTIQYCIL